MRSPRLLLFCGLAAGCSTVPDTVLSDASLVGVWKCGPTTMRGPGFDMVATFETTYRVDHTTTTLTTSVISPHTGVPVTLRDRADGEWTLEGDVLTSTVRKVEFVSSTDPTLGPQEGQGILEAQVRKKSVYRSRSLACDGRVWRSSPVDPMYAEADVETTCRRQ